MEFQVHMKCYNLPHSGLGCNNHWGKLYQHIWHIVHAKLKEICVIFGHVNLY